MTRLADSRVAIVAGSPQYPPLPFHAPAMYPEYCQLDAPVQPENQVYGMVRESFRLLGLDAAHYGTAEWNPLGELIRPGQRVVIKPNFVAHQNFGTGPLEAVITHGSVIRPIADYVLLALRNSGELIIGDSPQMNCDFATLCAANGMDGVAEYLQKACAKRGINFRLQDFRAEQTWYWNGIVWTRKKLRDLGASSVEVVLGRESMMEEIDPTLLYGADYDRQQTIQAHLDHRHIYCVAREVLDADTVISVPKLKVHSKVGTTLNIKNIVGINTDKNHLAHYRVGAPEKGGDEFSAPKWDDRLDRKLSDRLLGKSWEYGKYPFLLWRYVRRVLAKLSPANGDAYSFGNWHGNDTAWRMALDLNRVLLTADHQGKICDSAQRNYLSVIDGIIGGQGDGPLHPDAYESGVVLAGLNPLATDWVATRLMGLAPERISMYVHGVEQMREWVQGFDPDAIDVRSNQPGWPERLRAKQSVFHFAPPPGWRGAIENEDASLVADEARTNLAGSREP